MANSLSQRQRSETADFRSLRDFGSLIAAGTGAIWGLGLARLMAEAGFWALLYRSPLTVAGVAVFCAAIAFGVYRMPGFGQETPAKSGHPLLVFTPLLLPIFYVTGVISGPLAGGVLLVGGATLALLTMVGDRARWMPPAVLGLTTFALYLRTLLPGVGVADTFEFQVVVPRLGVAHPTGYPLYVLLGKLFTLLPLGHALSGAEGNVAWRVNLASAVFATAAVVLLYFLLAALIRISWLPAFLAALAFAVSATFWSQAVVAEVYTLHNLFVVAILGLLLPSDRGRARRWQAVFLLTGLSFANHMTTALLLPAVGLALLWERPQLRLRDWLTAVGLLLMGVSLYLFIPLRWPALNHGEWMTPGAFLATITGGQFQGALQLAGLHDLARWSIVLRLLREPFGWVGLALAAVGVVRLALRERRALVLTSVTFAAFILYGLAYHVPDISVFVIPAHLILAIWIGAGIAFIVELQIANGEWRMSDTRFAIRDLRSAFGHCPLFILHSSLFIVHWSLVILPLSLIWLNLPAVDQSHNRGRDEWGRYVLSLQLAPGAAILADVEKFAPLYYVQQIERLRPDLDIVLLGSEELYQAELAERLEQGQMVYLARYLPHLEGLHLHSVGPLAEVRAALPTASPAPETPLDVRFGDAVRLLGFDGAMVVPSGAGTSPTPTGVGTPLRLTLHWQAASAVEGDYLVRLRLLDDAGQMQWENEGARPVTGFYPTNAWTPREVIPDFHEIVFPPYLSPGAYRLQVGLFPPFSDDGLPVDGGDLWATITTLDVGESREIPPLPNSTRALFEPALWLIGYDAPVEATEGAHVAVTLNWRGRPAPGLRPRLAWVDGEGHETVVVEPAPRSNGSATIWQSRHLLVASVPEGTYTLSVGWADEAGNPVSARCGWLMPPSGSCPLAAVEILPAREGLANFADTVLLLAAGVGKTSVQPGEAIPVTLRWRGLRAMEEDYTVFVQLIGPDGRLHGQSDMWPVQGTHPTSQWAPGEEVSDSYQVPLAADAPPGRYQVHVGWYLLATMQRLQVVDADGRPSGDFFVASEFTVGD